jgi:hypothetical protein
MGSIGSITSTVQAVYASIASRKVMASSESAPTRDADGDGDHGPPGGDSIWASDKGQVIDVYA